MNTLWVKISLMPFSAFAANYILDKLLDWSPVSSVYNYLMHFMPGGHFAVPLNYNYNMLY